MEEIDLFSLESTSNTNFAASDAKILFFNGEKTNSLIKGESLDYQFQIGEFYLLLTTDLTSTGETVYFTLLNTDFEKIEDFFIGADIFSTFFLSNVKITGEREIEFCFGNDQIRRLTIYPKKTFDFKSFFYSNAVVKKNFLTHFILR